MTNKTIFVSSVLLVLAVFVAAALLYQSRVADRQDASLEQSRAFLHREGAPAKGAADAGVSIVEFFDPACGTCRDFYPYVGGFLTRYPGKVKIELRYAPLHPGSEQVVRMLEAANRQGQFWQALELLFENQERWVLDHVAQPGRAWSLLTALDLDHERLAADLHSEEVRQVVRQDVRDGLALKVQATPEFFVNGRAMPSFGYEQLETLVSEALSEAY